MATNKRKIDALYAQNRLHPTSTLMQTTQSQTLAPAKRQQQPSPSDSEYEESVDTEEEYQSDEYEEESDLESVSENDSEAEKEEVDRVTASMRYRKSTDPNAAKAYLSAVLDQTDEICSRIHKNQRCKNAFVDLLYSVDRYENTYADQLGSLQANAHYRKCLEYIRDNAQLPDMRASAKALLE